MTKHVMENILTPQKRWKKCITKTLRNGAENEAEVGGDTGNIILSVIAVVR
jgi:hypothetical protein